MLHKVYIINQSHCMHALHNADVVHQKHRWPSTLSELPFPSLYLFKKFMVSQRPLWDLGFFFLAKPMKFCGAWWNTHSSVYIVFYIFLKNRCFSTTHKEFIFVMFSSQSWDNLLSRGFPLSNCLTGGHWAVITPDETNCHHSLQCKLHAKHSK